MKKVSRFIFVTLFVLGLLLVSAPHQALAKEIKTTPSSPKIASGSWTSGVNVDVSTVAASAPNWLQLLSTDGVQTTAKGQICHPLRGGQFGWFGYIMQYKEGKWVKLETTNDWVPNKEGEFMACAQAPSAGTYALFGYWIRPANYYVESVEETSFDCTTVDWSGDLYFNTDAGGYIVIGRYISGVEDGTKITIFSDNIDGFITSGEGTVGGGIFSITTNLLNKYYDPELRFILMESQHNCKSPEVQPY